MGGGNSSVRERNGEEAAAAGGGKAQRLSTHGTREWARAPVHNGATNLVTDKMPQTQGHRTSKPDEVLPPCLQTDR